MKRRMFSLAALLLLVLSISVQAAQLRVEKSRTVQNVNTQSAVYAARPLAA